MPASETGQWQEKGSHNTTQSSHQQQTRKYVNTRQHRLLDSTGEKHTHPRTCPRGWRTAVSGGQDPHLQMGVPLLRTPPAAQMRSRWLEGSGVTRRPPSSVERFVGAETPDSARTVRRNRIACSSVRWMSPQSPQASKLTFKEGGRN